MVSRRTARKAAVIGICAVIGLMDPIQGTASAQNPMAKDILQTYGASSLLGFTMTQEEYLAAAQEAQGASWGYTNLGIANVDAGNLNVRQEPSVSGKLVGKMPRHSACEILDTVGDWAHVRSGEVEGYVKMHSADEPDKVYLLTGPDARMKAKELVRTVVRITADGVNVRDAASMDSSVLTQVPKGEEMDFRDPDEWEELNGEWYKVDIDGEAAYVRAEYAVVESRLDTAVTMTELLYGMGVSDVRVSLVEYAKQFLGNPYVWGGTSLTKGADCSGFVLSVFKHFGVSLSHSSRAQAKEGTKIKTSDLQPGDLIFYTNSSGTINHVAIYIGGGQVIHASNPKSGIKISKYNYRTPAKCVRVIKD